MARAVKSALQRVSGGSAGPELAEMARDVLDGRIDLRAIGQSSAYSPHLTEAIGSYQQWQAALSPEERETWLAEARRAFDPSPSTDR